MWENRKTLTARVARQVWVQRAAHSKRVAWKKPIPKKLTVAVGVTFVFMQTEPREHTQIVT